MSDSHFGRVSTGEGGPVVSDQEADSGPIGRDGGAQVGRESDTKVNRESGAQVDRESGTKAPIRQNKAAAGSVLIIVENLPVPFDRRVWQEATALSENGYLVSVICPKGKGHNKSYEQLNGVHIYRHPLPVEASGALGYLLEYSIALFWQFYLSIKIHFRHGFDVIHACNPPDLIFLIAAFHKIVFGKKFLFDQHDINPELYEAKFQKRGFFHKLLSLFEKWTFGWADASIATNETLKELAISRGKMPRERVWVVKSYPDMKRFVQRDPLPELKQDVKYLVGYVGIMAKQDGVDELVRAMAYTVHDLKRTDIGCIIIGDGPEYDSLQELARELQVEDYINFTGFLSGDPLLRHLCSIDVGIIPDPPNACNDKLSMNKVFEYMALGIPFVQFNLSQARKEAGGAAVVAEQATPESMADAMVELLLDPDRRARMAEYGKQVAQRDFHWEGQKISLLQAYADLLAQPKGLTEHPHGSGKAQPVQNS